MNTENYVPKGAIVVRLNENLLDDFTELHLRLRGSIFKTVDYSKNGHAHYSTIGGMIHHTNWRYATAFEMYCFLNINIQITNINQITEQHKQYFNIYLKAKNGDNNKNEIPRVEKSESSGIRPRAIGIRKPTKQIAIGCRFIGNATKGKRVKERIESIVIKTEAVKF